MNRDRMVIRIAFAATTMLIVSLSTLAIGSPSPQAQPSDRWTARLEALSPDHPVGYFELAEEIADATDDARELDLARRLFKLAGVLSPERLGRSVCLALADLESVEQVRSKYLVLASLLDETAGLGARAEAAARDDVPATIALDVSEAFSQFRQGQGPRALSTLRDGDALTYLERHEHVLPYGLRRFVADCNVYRGGQRPTLARSDVARMLRAEDALLSGAGRGWASDLLLTRGRTLVEVDPTRLPTALGLSAIRPLYRGGRWIAPDTSGVGNAR